MVKIKTVKSGHGVAFFGVYVSVDVCMCIGMDPVNSEYLRSGRARSV